MRTEVCQEDIWAEIEAGKSLPLSTIHETLRERGVVRRDVRPKRNDPPAPPRMSNTGGFGGR